MTRVLLERVTRFVLYRSLMDYGEPRYLRIEYSARGGLRYDQMNAYYEWLRMKRFKPFLPWGKLCFEVMHINLLRVYPHLEREGLQLADAVAAAFFKACDNTIRAPAIHSLRSFFAIEWRESQTTIAAGFRGLA